MASNTVCLWRSAIPCRSLRNARDGTGVSAPKIELTKGSSHKTMFILNLARWTMKVCSKVWSQ
nr:unnamed protein product [Callosobruchus chinensis]